MYQELLEEGEKKKELMKKLREAETRLEGIKTELKRRQDDVVFSKRKLELLQFDLVNLMRNNMLNEWPLKVRDLLAKHFSEKVERRATKSSEPVELAPAVDPAEAAEQQSIKEELIRQRNWMNSKLKNLVDKNKKIEKEKGDLYLKIQRENTDLIKECNNLRDDNQKITKKVQILEKKFRDICGISLSNSNVGDSQIEGFLKKAATLHLRPRETPFVSLKKGTGTQSSRNQLLIEYYN